MIIDCISDLHGYLPKLEGGDLLIVAGDLTARHEKEEYDEFMGWIDIYEHSYKKILIIAGNHDAFLEDNPDFINSHGYENIEYLFDSLTQFEGLKIYGLPWTPTFKGINPKCTAFTYDNETLFYDKKLMKIPTDIDILITHGPAFGILDGIPIEDGSLRCTGSTALYGWLKYVKRPKIHVFGHIHEAYGIKEVLETYEDKMMKSINCSFVNEKYKPVNKPIRIIL